MLHLKQLSYLYKFRNLFEIKVGTFTDFNKNISVLSAGKTTIYSKVLQTLSNYV